MTHIHRWQVTRWDQLDLPTEWECVECKAAYGYNLDTHSWGYLNRLEAEDE